jgi:hypothetical protein
MLQLTLLKAVSIKLLVLYHYICYSHYFCLYVEAFCILVNSVCWAPHDFGLILACGSSDGSISVITYTGKCIRWKKLC